MSQMVFFGATSKNEELETLKKVPQNSLLSARLPTKIAVEVLKKKTFEYSELTLGRGWSGRSESGGWKVRQNNHY